jgi:hypothetical protein
MQLALKLVTFRQTKPPILETKQLTSTYKCILCLEGCTSPTSTPCGYPQADLDMSFAGHVLLNGQRLIRTVRYAGKHWQ